MSVDPITKLILPDEFIDHKRSLKHVLNKTLEDAVLSLSHIKENYYLVLHAKFNPLNGDEFTISQPVMSYKLPPFTSNQMVFWVSPKKGICEMLWMVAPKKKGEKLKVEFNKEGVAYLQAKGAMPSCKAVAC